MRLILASQSPRRKEILSYFHFPFEQRSPHFDEESVPFHGDAVAYARELATGKALSIHEDEALILSADTVVFCAGKLFGKPATQEENVTMLDALAGKWHTVITAVVAKYGNRIESRYEETSVLFHPLTHAQILSYCSAFHLLDKAGGYAIQEGGGIIVKRIEGSYTNVMGLPLDALGNVLHPFGIDLWQNI